MTDVRWEAFDRNRRCWRDCRVTLWRPYFVRGRLSDGAIVSWADGGERDPVTGAWPSQGGWLSDHDIRVRVSTPPMANGASR